VRLISRCWRWRAAASYPSSLVLCWCSTRVPGSLWSRSGGCWPSGSGRCRGCGNGWFGVPAGCGRPVWVDDPGFHAARRVRILPCPDPGDEQALLDVAAVVIIEPLPRSRPLWAAALVPGVGGGRVGLVLVLHHVLADGVGGLAVLARLPTGPIPGPARAFRSRLRGLARFRAGWRELPTSLAAVAVCTPPARWPVRSCRRSGRGGVSLSPGPSWPGCGRRRIGTVALSTTCSSPRLPGPCTPPVPGCGTAPNGARQSVEKPQPRAGRAAPGQRQVVGTPVASTHLTELRPGGSVDGNSSSTAADSSAVTTHGADAIDRNQPSRGWSARHAAASSLTIRGDRWSLPQGPPRRY
jgi:hypothetical protein